jgi:fructosamine-3-kinase
MGFFNEELNNIWLEAIREYLNDKSVEINTVAIVGGGSINDARKVDTSKGLFFAKINDAHEYPGMFEAEEKGLNFLRENSKFNIPKPVKTGITDDTQWLLMEFINRGSKSENYWETFGETMADMHRHSHDQFGFESDNYLGSLKQKNGFENTWPEFFAKCRLEPQLKMAKDQGEASDEMVRLIEKVMSRAERYFPEEPASAVHGDMWTGNFSIGQNGEATIYDPAAYYGHREMDIGMSKLFGGYDDKFYKAYNAAYPMEDGWEGRIPIANLYPLLAHLNIFGGSYASQIMSILRKYA